VASGEVLQITVLSNPQQNTSLTNWNKASSSDKPSQNDVFILAACPWHIRRSFIIWN